MTNNIDKLKNKSIKDFGEQWSHFTNNPNYYGSKTVLLDILGPNFNLKTINGSLIVDVGAGTGRLINSLANLGAREIIAVEPSKAFEVLQKNVKHLGSKVRCLNICGDKLPQSLKADLIISIGVIHHIPDPKPVLDSIYSALKEGGTAIIWLYGYEGNKFYLSLIKPLRKVTILLPHFLLLFLCKLLEPILNIYAKLCEYINLPLSNYMLSHISLLDKEARTITIYDQLNPAYSNYYTKNEAIELMKASGFTNIKYFHRHGYSWTISGLKK